MVAGYKNCSELVSRQTVHIPTESTVQEEMIKLKKDDIITEKHHRNLSHIFRFIKTSKCCRLFLAIMLSTTISSFKCKNLAKEISSCVL